MKRRMVRKCLVCGNKIKIKLDEKRHYDNGHYFGKMELPVGKGEYKKIGTSKIFGKKIDVAEWTGKKEKVEYWECNECYKQGQEEDKENK